MGAPHGGALVELMVKDASEAKALQNACIWSGELNQRQAVDLVVKDASETKALKNACVRSVELSERQAVESGGQAIGLTSSAAVRHMHVLQVFRGLAEDFPNFSAGERRRR